MAVALIVAGGAVASWWLWRTAGLLPPRIETEELVEDLSLQLDPARLSAYFLVGDRARRALVAPPPSTFRLHAHVPEGGVLGFGVGVASAGHPDPGAASVRFSATVDGREVFSRVLGPGARRRDRRWDDERIDLGAFVGREVEIALRTAVEGAGTAAGTPAWSNLAIVRRRSKERQLAGPDQPSVILLLVDTLRADRLGCYGANPSRTPRLDHLAGEGLLFENAIAQSSWTLPSIASIFTGLHMRSHGMVGGSGSAPAAPGGAGNGGFLPDSLLTLAGHARLGGITTVGVSANPLVSRGTNLAHGFETFVEFPDDGPQTNWTPATKVNRQFVRWLRQNRRYRFFAYLHYMEPHAPYRPPEALRPPAPAGATPEILAGVPPVRRINLRGGPPLLPEQLAYLRGAYDGEVRVWDEALGGLMDALTGVGAADSVVIVMTADHGEEFLEHGRLYHGSHLYEESVRVPLIVAGPGVRPGRAREAAQGIDIFPTVSSLLGLSVPPGLPGRSLLAPIDDRPVISETSHGIGPNGEEDAELIALRTAQWKLIEEPAVGRFELYDLARDPAERNDRFGQAPEGDTLVQALTAWRASVTAAAPAPGSDPALRQKLRALGYVD